MHRRSQPILQGRPRLVPEQGSGPGVVGEGMGNVPGPDLLVERIQDRAGLGRDQARQLQQGRPPPSGHVEGPAAGFPGGSRREEVGPHGVSHVGEVAALSP